MAWQTWSPFQSPEVREICRNLSEDEKRDLMEESARFGATVGRFMMPFAGVGMALGVAALAAMQGMGWRRWVVAAGVMLIVECIAMAIFWPRARRMRQHFRERLCETQYARQQGFTPDRLRMFAFSRRAPKQDPGRDVPEHFR